MKILNRIKEFLYRNRIKFLAILLFQILALFLFTVLPILSRQDFYKEFILSEIEKATGLDIQVYQSDLVLFPFPGIELNSVLVRKGEVVIGISDRIKVDISWFGLLGQKVEIRDIYISGGKINLHKLKDGSVDLIEFLQKDKKNEEESKTSKKTNTIRIFDPSEDLKVPFNPKEVLKIGLKNVQVENFFVNYQDDTHQRTYGIYLWNSSFSVPFYGNSLDLSLQGKLDEQSFQIYGSAGLEEFPTSLEKIQFQSTIILDHCSLSIFRDLLFIFPNADFSKTIFSGTIKINKGINEPIRFNVSANAKNFAYRGGNAFGNLRTNFELKLDIPNKKLEFPYITVIWPGVAEGAAKGTVFWNQKTNASFQISANYLDYHRVLRLGRLFELTKEFDDPRRPNGVFYFSADLKNVYALKHRFPVLKAEMKYSFPWIQIPSFHAYIYNGEILGKANINPFRSKFEVQGEVYRILSDRIIMPYVSERILNGNLFSKFNFTTEVNDRSEDFLSDFFKNMEGGGSFQILNGELFGYANFMIPVLNTLGKIISFNGIDGRKVEFASLKSDFKIANNRFYFINLKLQGNGLEADGKGDIGFDKNVDVLINLRLGGNIVGRALKIPIIYKGLFKQSIPYIDPIWLGSVFAGSTILAPFFAPVGGPYGGGIAGSVVSEYVRDAWEGFKGLFSSKENKPKK
ncbi:AsmA family protein [Leptospira gomenensis]|uniref:AsmA family protein n=1 Tax=Leptospira gomenensis TaxID=2484974 RepID=A0A5F1Y604_9LEPT|nr:AsmA family protein [Leptospira gomenensis]TGK27907.1 AsmA family protein [Leptospira gomenensis]TGK45487.1 AsmA family protein [Leptospira gomenensis]TGK45874.1 AsmA family protein [Leptospira gomenensis]TGK65200.1 AsmA family protein [Leptospira gomenensis]